MGLWTRLTTWLFADDSQTSSSVSETSPTAVLERSASREPDATSSQKPGDRGSTEAAGPPWWRPEGAVVDEEPKLDPPAEDDLTDSGERAVLASLEAALDNADIDLPHLPRVPEQALTMLRLDTTSMRDIAQLVSQDQVLSAALLRRANSVAYGGAVKVKALDAALARLGVRGTKSFMISESVKQITLSVGDGHARGPRLWHEALATGYVLAIYSEALGVPFEDPFLAGLLHDIGKVVILRACHDAERAQHTRVSDLMFEYLCQEYHEMMGAMIAEQWHLPDEVGELLGKHHGPLEEDDARSPQRAAVQLTEATVALLGHGRSVPYDLLALPAARHLGLSPEGSVGDVLETLPEVLDLAMSAD